MKRLRCDAVPHTYRHNINHKPWDKLLIAEVAAYPNQS
jgi:hypothetical protein